MKSKCFGIDKHTLRKEIQYILFALIRCNLRLEAHWIYRAGKQWPMSRQISKPSLRGRACLHLFLCFFFLFLQRNIYSRCKRLSYVGPNIWLMWNWHNQNKIRSYLYAFQSNNIVLFMKTHKKFMILGDRLIFDHFSIIYLWFL